MKLKDEFVLMQKILKSMHTSGLHKTFGNAHYEKPMHRFQNNLPQNNISIIIFQKHFKISTYSFIY